MCFPGFTPHTPGSWQQLGCHPLQTSEGDGGSGASDSVHCSPLTCLLCSLTSGHS